MMRMQTDRAMRLGFLLMGYSGAPDVEVFQRQRAVRRYNEEALGGKGVGQIDDDGSALAGLLCHMVEVGAIPYRERYEGRHDG